MPLRPTGLRRRPPRSIRRLFRPRCDGLEARTLLATVTWINPAGGDWDTPSNWSTGTIPGLSDDAVIALAGVTVAHSSSVADSVNNLTISATDATLDLSNGSLALAADSSIAGDLVIRGGTLSTAGTVTVGGAINWSGGTLSISGTVDADGGMTITGGSLTGGTLNNQGAATLSGSISVGDGAVINNLAGSTFDVQGDTALGYGGGAFATFNNDAGATFAVSNDGNGGTQANVLFNNAGAVDVNSGGLTVGFSYANSVLGSATSSGSFYGAPGTSLVFGSVSQDFTPTSSIDAANVGFVVGSFDVEGSYAASGTTHLDVGAGVNFTGTVTSVGTALDITPFNANASANFSPAVPVTLTTNECTITGGLRGTDSFVIAGPLTLQGSFFLGTSGTVDAQGAMAISTGYNCQIQGVTINNSGAATVSGDYDIGVGDGAVINNLAGAVFDVQGDESLVYGGGAFATFNNEAGATFLKSSGAGSTNLDLEFNNDGTVDAQSGTLSLGGGTSFTDISSGTFQGAAGATINFTADAELTAASIVSADNVGFAGANVDEAGTYDVSGQTFLNVGAHVNFTGTVVSVGNALDIAPWNADAFANFSPAVPVTLTTNECTITGGLRGTDSFVIAGPLTLQGSFFLGTSGTVDAQGTVTISTGYNCQVQNTTLDIGDGATLSGAYGVGVGDGAVINNLAGSTFDVQGDTALGYGGGAFATFNNSGVLLKSSGTGVTDLQVNTVNSGTVEVQAGTLNLAAGAPLGMINSGEVLVAADTTLDSAPYLQNGGSTILSGGTLGGGPFNINSGILSGSGTINANMTNGGQILPGGSGAAGLLTINGSYTQTATGVLDIDLGGTTAVSQYDQLAISGTAALAGSLDVDPINGFHPAVSNTFQVLSFGSSSGNFTTFNSPDLGGGLFLDPVYGPGNLTLDTDQVAITGAPAFPLQGIPIDLAGSVTGPSSGNFAPAVFAWTVTLNGNPYQAGSGSTFSFTPNLSGTYLVTLTVTDPAGGMGTTTLPVVVVPSIYVLNATASGALTLSGNASINLPGLVVVDSSSKTAVSASGSAQVTASAIDVVGGVQQTGTATFHPTPTTGITAMADPLGGLLSPGISGMTDYGSVKLSGSSQVTICPGIYSQVSVSGGASLTLNPGIYIIMGGGFTVTGNASVSGTGVMIYNAGSNYPGTSGSFGGITLGGTGRFNLTAPTSGLYAGILIFQSRQNTRALSVSGNATGGMSGVIYAANALLSMSGNASLTNPLDVGMLNLSGNVSLTQIAAGSDGSGDASGLADTLLAGNLSVYINDPSSDFTSDELARIQDAIDAWDTILVSYNVTITEVSDPTLANLVIDTGTTSACGGMADSVLGCYNGANQEITIVQGWSWYAGADPSQIDASQYDFETTVTHELGHALGLGHSPDPTSPMYETLATGVADRAPTTQDLNIPDPPDGADPQKAAGFQPVVPAVFASAAPASDTGAVDLMPLSDAMAAHDAVMTGWHARHRAAMMPHHGEAARRSVVGHRARLVAHSGTSRQQHQLVDRALESIGALRPMLDVEAAGTSGHGRV